MGTLVEEAAVWHGDRLRTGLQNCTTVNVQVGGMTRLISASRERYDDYGGKRVDIVRIPLDCTHFVDDVKDAAAVGTHLYCTRCASRCDCGEMVIPGSAERFEGQWYHRECNHNPGEHVAFKRHIEESLLVEKLKGTRLQGELASAQIDATRSNTQIQERRFELETERERAQIALAHAQTDAVAENMQLQRARFELDQEQARERIELERQAAEQRAYEHDSKMQSDEQERRIKEEQLRISILERMQKLHDERRQGQ